jgi:sulfur carrier protein
VKNRKDGRKMTITVAGEKKEYEEGIVLTSLIEKEEVENAEYVTVTINDEFVDRENFPSTVLKDGDVVEFLYFMGGGAK